jgi:hypothetical protein
MKLFINYQITDDNGNVKARETKVLEIQNEVETIEIKEVGPEINNVLVEIPVI